MKAEDESRRGGALSRACKAFNGSYRGAASPELLRTLDLVVASACLGTMLIANTTGAALTGYASAVGAKEFLFGLFSALPVLGTMAQLLASAFIERTGKRKTLFMVGGIAQRSAWILAALAPSMLPAEGNSRLVALLSLITLASAFGALVNVTHTSMVAEVVPMGVRGRFVTTRQRMITVSSMATGLGAAFLLDALKDRGLLGYAIVFGVGGALGLADILMYARFHFPDMPRSAERLGFAAGVRACFETPKTRHFIVFWTVWSFSVNISAPFFNKYALDMLGLSFREIIFFGQVTANAVTVLVVARWGRFIDRYGCAPLLMASGSLTAVFVLLWLPAAPGSAMALFAFNLLGGFVWCANDSCAANMQLSHTPDIGRPLIIAIYAVVTSVSTAVAYILGGLLLDRLQPVMAEAGLTVMGTPFDHYKALFCVSAALRLAAVLVFVPRIWNERGRTVKDSYAEIWQRARRRVAYARWTLAHLPGAWRALRARRLLAGQQARRKAALAKFIRLRGGGIARVPHGGGIMRGSGGGDGQHVPSGGDGGNTGVGEGGDGNSGGINDGPGQRN